MEQDLRITAAAVKQGDIILTGPRHAPLIHEMYERTQQRVTQEQQGFIASNGKFYNRWQAGIIAFDAGQTKTKKRELISEDLW